MDTYTLKNSFVGRAAVRKMLTISRTCAVVTILEIHTFVVLARCVRERFVCKDTASVVGSCGELLSLVESRIHRRGTDVKRRADGWYLAGSDSLFIIIVQY